MRRRTPVVAFALSTLLLAFAAVPARAANGDGLRALLAYVPSPPSNPAKGLVDYFDVAVAAAMTVRSSNRRPTICRPTGRPAADSPTGTLAAG